MRDVEVGTALASSPSDREETMISVETVTSDNPKPLANYSEAMRAGSLVFAAGQIASDYKTGVAPE
jgi:enamine deaminase RidA (YjgF/YER057c/UK114 family)